MAGSRPRVAAVFRGRITARDVAIHLVVALAMILAYLSPVPFEAFVFVPGVDGPADAYLSVLGHATPAHLLGNAVGFLALGGCGVLLLGGTTRRRRTYYVAFVALFVLVPPLAALQWVLSLSMSDSSALGSTGGAGFSVLTAAFAALLAVALALAARDALESPLPPVVASGCLVALSLAVLGAAVGGPVPVTAGAAAVGLVYLAHVARIAAAAVGDPGGAVTVSRVTIALSVYVGATVDLFVTRAGPAVRPHAVGFVLGFAIAWLVVGLERRW